VREEGRSQTNHVNYISCNLSHILRRDMKLRESFFHTRHGTKNTLLRECLVMKHDSIQNYHKMGVPTALR